MRPVVIAGPTASGKSALALAIAERDNGWVINADALQVYGCWRVLTARPDTDVCARAPHRLYGHVPCDVPYSVGAWLREVAPVIDAARAAGARPVIVGGTGLYLTALTLGLHAIPPTPPAVRARSDALLRAGGPAALADDLARDDPATLALLDRNNPRRLQRAWEVLTATGRGLVAWRSAATAPVLDEQDALRFLLSPEVTFLNRSIRARFELMLEEGALEECARFRAQGGDLALPSGRALGAADLLGYLDGRLSLAAATDAAVAATRRYAKRQRTWFRNHMAAWTRIDTPDALDRISRF